MVVSLQHHLLKIVEEKVNDIENEDENYVDDNEYNLLNTSN